MHCQTCANAVRDSLRSVNGVEDARVEFQNGRATVKFDPALTDEGSIRKAIGKAGQRVT